MQLTPSGGYTVPGATKVVLRDINDALRVLQVPRLPPLLSRSHRSARARTHAAVARRAVQGVAAGAALSNSTDPATLCCNLNDPL